MKWERSEAKKRTRNYVDRRMNLDVVICPPNCEVLIGQIVLEGMDLIVDSTEQRLTSTRIDVFTVNKTKVELN